MSSVNAFYVRCNGHNTSHHYPLFMSLKIDTFTFDNTANRSRCARIMWDRVTMENISSCKLDLDILLTELSTP